MNKIWNELLEFETMDLVERYIKNRFNRKPGTNKVIQITSNFIQGREYFKSADTASITVKPLLQYYGVLALSKGLILFLKDTLTEDQLKSSHGLEIKNWKKPIKDRNFDELEIKVGEGTFSELLSATENKNYLRSNSSSVNWQSYLRTPEKGAVIKLKELIQYFPDLDKEYESWIGEKLKYAVLRSLRNEHGTDDQRIHMTMEGIVKQEVCDNLFPDQYFKAKEIIYTNETIVRIDSHDWVPNITQKWHGPFEIGDACVIPTLQDDIGLNLLGAMYTISYVFGMMARYYPSVWISLRRVEKGDRIYPFAIRTLDYIQDKFPVQVLDFLRSPYPFEKI
jgi:hypothetical protein